MRHGCIRKAWIAVVLTIVGCQPVDRPLNSHSIGPEKWVHNATRAAVLAEVIAPQDEEATGVKPQTSVRPTSGPAATPADGDGVFVGLAISGGGSRSANFAAACMLQLQRLGLMQRVDYISTVSGGSLAGAYYCVSDDTQWVPANVQKELTHHFATDAIYETLLPWNWIGFTFSSLDRSDLLAGVFAKNLLGRDGKPLTFADLRADRPRLLINATDLQAARRFVFCNETFDGLNSNLAKYPLSYAVTASSAVPVVLHPVALEDYSTTFVQYRHLVDGGVIDNLGVQTLAETYGAQVRSAADRGQPDPYPKGAVFVLLDAKTRFNSKIGDSRDIGLIASLESAAGLTSTVLVNRASSATLSELIVNGAQDTTTAAQIRNYVTQLSDDGFIRFTDKRGHPVRVLYVALAQVNSLRNVPSSGFTEYINSMGTYFNISHADARGLYEAASLLMHEKFEARVKELLEEISPGKGTPTATGPSTVKSAP
ncbi:MAG TPA: patatin-like phospholipase family protein [Humisphaera sp.]|jgi:predicted acylesterase/phospholipase RssA|nr:patatin-like phospholipase family protein [Humisphaera sp.]